MTHFTDGLRRETTASGPELEAAPGAALLTKAPSVSTRLHMAPSCVQGPAEGLQQSGSLAGPPA